MNYPNMIEEVLEAVHLMYEDYPDVETDCYLYLLGLSKSAESVVELGQRVSQLFEDNDRCPTCGEPLKEYYYEEPHPELDNCPMEEMMEKYCGECNNKCFFS